MRWKCKGLALTLDLGIAVLCVSLLFLAGVVGFQVYIKSAKISQARADVASLALAVSRYSYDMASAYPNYNPAQCLPSNLTTLASQNTTTGSGPWISGNALKKSGTSYLDPWGRAYVYSHGSTTDGRFVVYSKGPDGNGSVALDGTVTKNGIGACGGYKT